MTQSLLAIDQGTTSTRAVVVSSELSFLSQANVPLASQYPQPGWVEQDPRQIWQSLLTAAEQAIEQAGTPVLAGIALTNQRETTLIWDRDTGECVCPALVWQDRRSSGICDQWLAQGWAEMVRLKTGLLIDPYFCAPKIAWILDNMPGTRAMANDDRLAFGTVDSYLLWQLTGGQSHLTDITNASRTLLFNIHSQQWDEELLRYFDIPMTLLPAVQDSHADFGVTDAGLFGRALPICAMMGDQQAAAMGQGCIEPGQMKSTYGTGCFMLLNTGKKVIHSAHRLISTIAYRYQGQVSYALEGSIFVAGAAVSWLRDAMQLIDTPAESETFANQVPDNQGVYLIPAFTGLGAPYWDPLARGAILGLTRDTGCAHIVRAALESVCYQSRDLCLAMQADGAELRQIRVDGGMVVNDWLMQFLADMLAVPVERPIQHETTVLGVAFMGWLQLGVFTDLAPVQGHWQLGQLFTPSIDDSTRENYYQGWQAAIQRIRQ